MTGSLEDFSICMASVLFGGKWIERSIRYLKIGPCTADWLACRWGASSRTYIRM